MLIVKFYIDGSHAIRYRFKLDLTEAKKEILIKTPGVLTENTLLREDITTLTGELNRVTQQRDDLKLLVDTQIEKDMLEFEEIKK